MAFSHNPVLQRLIGDSFLERMLVGYVARSELFMLKRHKNPDTVRLIRQVRKDRQSLQTAAEQFVVHSVARAYGQVPGDFAEVGVFQGCSARLICDAKGDKPLHLFDTFEGLPAPSEKDRGVHEAGWFACSLESVQEYLRGYPNVHYYKGLFPQSAAGLEANRFAFVHLDVDLYESTLESLKFFYPRMPPGGVILSHDYSLLSGVKQAFEEFCRDKTERPVELPSTLCMLIKL